MTEFTWLTLGRVTGVHGLAGNLKIWSYAESPETFEKGRRVRLVDEGDTVGTEFTIARASARKKGVLLTLEGVGTREASEALVGKEILMDKAQLPALEEDTWYWEDLTGLEVTDPDAGDLGQVERLFSTGADDILVVLDNEKNEVLIPMNRHFVDHVDLDRGRITTCLPPGFIRDQAE